MARWKKGQILECDTCHQKVKVTKEAEVGEGAVVCCGVEMRKGGS